MKSSSRVLNFDFIVIGSGLAGLVFALDVAKKGTVAVLTKREMKESNTQYAQGGIAAVTSFEDSFDLHLRDTLSAGDGLCRQEAVKMLVEGGPDAIKYLTELGVRFTHSNSSPASPLDLHREGGHSIRRVVHSDDLTGQELERALIKAVKNEKNISVFEHHTAIDLVLRSRMEGKRLSKEEVIGAFALDSKTGNVITLLSPATFLATGGCGKVYLYTSNPDVSSGDGVAMASRAGARITNMEFMQFHPTIVYHPDLKSFLISEAVRGEGAVLRLINGKTFMENYHPMKDLATRDIVARAIDTEMKRRGDEFVYLDATKIGADKIREKFPNIYRTLLDKGMDMTMEMIPVVPAAHHITGGVDVDLWGRASIKGLYAGGENACTGVHGANRLASNSLLEAVVFSRRAAQKTVEEWKPMRVKTANPWTSGDATDSDEQVVITQNWDEIRRVMWNYVGILRSNKRLVRAQRRIKLFGQEIREYYKNFTVTSDLIELRNITACADIIVKSALSRRESRGLHFNIDYPKKLKKPKETIVVLPVRNSRIKSA